MKSTYYNKSDENLWKDLNHGNHQAFKEVFTRFGESLFQYGFQTTTKTELIKDTIQELFLDVWRTRSQKKQVQHVKTYLIKALRYKLLRTLKNERHYEEIDDGIHGETPSVESTQIILELHNEQAYKLRLLLDLLPCRQREVIHLKFYQGLTVAQISEVWAIKPQSVSNLLNRSISSLRKEIQKKLTA